MSSLWGPFLHSSWSQRLLFSLHLRAKTFQERRTIYFRRLTALFRALRRSQNFDQLRWSINTMPSKQGAEEVYCWPRLTPSQPPLKLSLHMLFQDLVLIIVTKNILTWFIENKLQLLVNPNSMMAKALSKLSTRSFPCREQGLEFDILKATAR